MNSAANEMTAVRSRGCRELSRGLPEKRTWTVLTWSVSSHPGGMSPCFVIASTFDPYLLGHVRARVDDMSRLTVTMATNLVL